MRSRLSLTAPAVALLAVVFISAALDANRSGSRLREPGRAAASQHDDHRGPADHRRIVHAARIDQCDHEPAPVLPRRRRDQADEGIAHPLRGLAAAREVEREVRRRGQRRLGRHDQLRRARRPDQARLRDRLHEYRPRGGARRGHGQVRLRASGTADRLRLSLPSRNGDERQSARAGVLRQGLPSAPIGSGVRPAATKG